MAYSNTPTTASYQAIKDVSHTPYWRDDPCGPGPRPKLTQGLTTDLLIIGGGFTGLWTALLAKQENPNREIILMEASEIAKRFDIDFGYFDRERIQEMVRTKPTPFPPEPFRSMGIIITRWSVEQADRLRRHSAQRDNYLPNANTQIELPSFPILNI